MRVDSTIRKASASDSRRPASRRAGSRARLAKNESVAPNAARMQKTPRQERSAPTSAATTTPTPVPTNSPASMTLSALFRSDGR